jgi:hypothetical protein
VDFEGLAGDVQESDFLTSYQVFGAGSSVSSRAYIVFNVFYWIYIHPARLKLYFMK